MKKEIIFELESPYRDTMRITAFHFGDYDNPQSEKACAIVGATRGDEVQQIYICARLVELFKKFEKEGKIEKGKQIVIIPTVNNYSMNIKKRFWSLDNTDINRMFPGYYMGETTQRIAYNVFEYIKKYSYGIQFASHYMLGSFMPHVRMMHTGYENPKLASDFGLPYVYVRDSKPYDTTTLNYNLQIWDTPAFSIYAGKTKEIDDVSAEAAISSVIRFLKKTGICNCNVEEGVASQLINHNDIAGIKTKAAGILHRVKKEGEKVKKGELLGTIIDPYDCTLRQEFYSPCDGVVFFANTSSFIYESTCIYRIIFKSGML